MLYPSSLVLSQGWGLIALLLRASNEGSPRPRVARAQIYMLLPSLLVSPLKGVVWIYPLLRALTEHGP
jgi:hypothetical protein